MDHIMFGVIVDAVSTDIIKFNLSGSLTELQPDDIQELAEMLAETSDAWKDVLKGTRAAVIFDAETLDKIRINKGIIEFKLNP